MAIIIDHELRKKYRKMACEISGCYYGNSGHHIMPKGMGGGKCIDIEINLICMCKFHHDLLHGIGEASFIRQYPIYETILKSKGWEYNPVTERYVNYELQEILRAKEWNMTTTSTE